MAEVWTTGKLLEWIKDYFTKNGVDSPRLSAEMLLAHILGTKRIDLYVKFDQPVEEARLAPLREFVKRCGQHEPLAYLIGKTEFYSMEFAITPDCLIPRPETEMLVQRAVEFLRLKESRQRMLDLCTGSGCVAVAVAKNHPAADIVATDISDAALAVAARNVEKHKLTERVKLLCGDLFDAILTGLDVTQFDLITANPPYVSSAEYEKLARNVKDYEPKIALLAGTDGLDVYMRIVGGVDRFLKPGAALMMEIGYRQAVPIRKLLEATGIFSRVTVEKDFSNNDRVVTAVKASK
jgi:release factor glutamine methyltransferase